MCELPCPLPVSPWNWSLLPEGLATWVGCGHDCSPQSVPGQDYRWFGGCRRRNWEGARRQEAVPGAVVLSGGEGFQADRIRMELDFPVRKAAHRSINLSLLPHFFLCFPPHTHFSLFCFLGCRNPPSFLVPSRSLPPSFPCLSVLERGHRQASRWQGSDSQIWPGQDQGEDTD